MTLARGRIAFDLQAILWRFDRAGVADEFDAGVGLADICRAKVEGVAGEVDADAVEEFAAEGLDAGDITAAGRDEFLEQGGMIDAEVHVAGGHGFFEIV